MTQKTPNPCLFCGCTKIDTLGGPDIWWMHCDNCEAEGPLGSSESESIELWNKRSEVKDENN